jgi:hypothetical protein
MLGLCKKIGNKYLMLGPLSGDKEEGESGMLGGAEAAEDSLDRLMDDPVYISFASVLLY